MIAEQAAPLLESGEVTVRFVGEGPDGFAELRFRPSFYTGALDAYLEELYVVPERRGHGLGRALLEAAMEHARDRGAAHIDLNTSETDVAARTLYESAGFTNREGGPNGPRMLYYERDLSQTGLRRFLAQAICDGLPPVATTGLHKGSIRCCQCWLRNYYRCGSQSIGSPAP